MAWEKRASRSSRSDAVPAIKNEGKVRVQHYACNLSNLFQILSSNIYEYLSWVWAQLRVAFLIPSHEYWRPVTTCSPPSTQLVGDCIIGLAPNVS